MSTHVPGLQSFFRFFTSLPNKPPAVEGLMFSFFMSCGRPISPEETDHLIEAWS